MLKYDGVQGATYNAKKNEDINNILSLMDIEYNPFNKVQSPATSLMLATALNVMTTIQQNNNVERANKLASQQQQAPQAAQQQPQKNKQVVTDESDIIPDDMAALIGKL